MLLSALAAPVPVTFLVFGNVTEAGEWLRTLWQVVAAALALSLTIMVFALEIFGRSGVVRYGGTLNAFAKRAGLARVFRLGVIALIIDGVVLANVGYGAPGGWAALVASSVSAGAIVSLPFVLNRVLRETDTDQIQAVRTTILQEAVANSVCTQVTETFALAELQRLAKAHDFDAHVLYLPM